MFTRRNFLKKSALSGVTILAFETSSEELGRVVGAYWFLFGTNSDNDFKSLAQKISPMMSMHKNDYVLNAELYKRIKSVYDARNDSSNDYEFISDGSGSVEEKIDRMIREKSRLAEDMIGSGEDWLGGMGVNQLRELVALEEKQ